MPISIRFIHSKWMHEGPFSIHSNSSKEMQNDPSSWINGHFQALELDMMKSVSFGSSTEDSSRSTAAVDSALDELTSGTTGEELSEFPEVVMRS
ncbi:hypothetical protein HAX54_015473 [Datura stramonium]|uniref:Uncharacterized protein n=1 Tax=Datura stramonium TaxID=4076 RepID=A0ABS8RZG3_DATST|nr:hypothetical protein [Datura stramonium]